MVVGTSGGIPDPRGRRRHAAPARYLLLVGGSRRSASRQQRASRWERSLSNGGAAASGAYYFVVAWDGRDSRRGPSRRSRIPIPAQSPPRHGDSLHADAPVGRRKPDRGRVGRRARAHARRGLCDSQRRRRRLLGGHVAGAVRTRPPRARGRRRSLAEPVSVDAPTPSSCRASACSSRACPRARLPVGSLLHFATPAGPGRSVTIPAIGGASTISRVALGASRPTAVAPGLCRLRAAHALTVENPVRARRAGGRQCLSGLRSISLGRMRGRDRLDSILLRYRRRRRSSRPGSNRGGGRGGQRPFRGRSVCEPRHTHRRDLSVSMPGSAERSLADRTGYLVGRRRRAW